MFPPLRSIAVKKGPLAQTVSEPPTNGAIANQHMNCVGEKAAMKEGRRKERRKGGRKGG